MSDDESTSGDSSGDEGEYPWQPPRVDAVLYQAKVPPFKQTQKKRGMIFPRVVCCICPRFLRIVLRIFSIAFHLVSTISFFLHFCPPDFAPT